MSATAVRKHGQGSVVKYVTPEGSERDAILWSQAPGTGCWWAKDQPTLMEPESRGTVKIAERTREKSRRWYEVD